MAEPNLTGSNARAVALGAILLGVSVASGLLLSPGLSSQQVPELTVADVGKPFRASSLSGFKASRDFEVADEARTSEQREQARAQVAPVFDFDAALEGKVKQGVRAAFADLQALATSAPLDTKRADAGTSSTIADWKTLFARHAVLPEDEDFEALAQAGFSAELEQAVMQLLEIAYRSRVVASRDEVSRLAPTGIAVRLLGGSGEQMGDVKPPGVLDLKEVGAELDRYASVPGNILADAPPSLKRAALRLAKKQVRANLSINLAETEARRQAAWGAVKPVVLSVKKGQRIIGDGELVTAEHLLLVRGLRAQLSELDVIEVQFGGLALVALLLAGCWLSFTAAFKRFRPSKRDALAMGLWGVGLLAFLQLWVIVADAVHDRYSAIPVEALHYAFPIAAGAMLVRFVMNEESALFFGLVFSCLASLMLGGSLGTLLFALLTSFVAADRIARVKDRGGIFRAGFVTGLVGASAVIFFSLASGKGFGLEVVVSAAMALAASVVLVPMLVLTLTPAVEAAFGYASDLKLLELANLNHPALKELVLQAPGTYHHSIIMGSLVEAAAESIGANPLLARSCAYYHDIGKGRNPAYFGENQKGENGHDQLAPAMSAVIIKRHVTEGLEMARQYKLPRRVADAIPQHHGTRLVGYFYNKAKVEAEAREGSPPVDEALFRYPGPKPQFREAALVMIADAVEAASRAMAEPTPDKLRGLVQKLINGIFSEGQLDECDLTLRDLRLIAESFVHTLDGIYHARPAYPPGAFGAPSMNPVALSASPSQRQLSIVRDPKKASPE